MDHDPVQENDHPHLFDLRLQAIETWLDRKFRNVPAELRAIYDELRQALRDDT